MSEIVESKLHPTWVIILSMLKQEVLRVSELSEAIGLTENAIRRALKRMKEQDLVHIGGWYRVVGKSSGWSAIWTYGPGEDKPEPTRTKRDRRAANNRHYAKFQGVFLAKQRAARGVGVVDMEGEASPNSEESAARRDHDPNFNPFAQLIAAVTSYRV